MFSAYMIQHAPNIYPFYPIDSGLIQAILIGILHCNIQPCITLL